jgi:hypothetical protein
MRKFAIAELKKGTGQMRARVLCGGYKDIVYIVYPETDDLSPGDCVLISFSPEDQFCKVLAVCLDSIQEVK